MFIVKMVDHDGNHRCLVEKNVPIASRDGDHELSMTFLYILWVSCTVSK